MQEDPRPPLCVYCVAASFSTAAALSVLCTGEPFTLGPLWDLKSGFEIANGYTPINFCAGNPPLFVAVIRAIGPRDDVRFRINADIANPWAEFEYFGAKVCATHIHTAIEAWNMRHNPGNRRIGY